MNQTGLRTQIESVLDQLKSKGYSRSDIEKALRYSENYIDQQLSKGGNKRFLNSLKAFSETILQKTTVEQSPTVEDVPEADLKVAIRELSQSTNRHSIIDERNSRNIERLISLLELKYTNTERHDKNLGLPRQQGARRLSDRDKKTSTKAG